MEIYLYKLGLEGVIDIEQYCNNNNIVVEDVTGFFCGHNKITALKGLDKLLNLEYLSCSNNKLTELDVSNLVNLAWLYCGNNKLTELDVSKLVNLKWLDCYNNQLTELDVSKLVNLKELYCYNNKLTELDVAI